MKKIKLLFVCSVALMTFATSVAQQPKPWVVPDKDKNMKNPVAVNDASIKAGQALYVKNCAACHGKTGLGDGPKSKSLKTAMTSFTKAEFQNQTDGELFFRTKTGRGDMTKFEGKLSENDIWNVVNYTRTFKK